MNIGRRAYGETDSANNTQTYYHTDSLGSVLATSKANKSIAARYDYDAWGKELNNTDTSDNPLGYTGHQMDRESENKTGLIYANARYLDPDTGRFLSFDPFEGYDDKPISLNKYLYAYQNPVRYTDPTGMAPVFEETADGLSEWANEIRDTADGLDNNGINVFSAAGLGLGAGLLDALSGVTEVVNQGVNITTDALADENNNSYWAQQSRSDLAETRKEIVAALHSSEKVLDIVKENPSGAANVVLDSAKESAKSFANGDTGTVSDIFSIATPATIATGAVAASRAKSFKIRQDIRKLSEAGKQETKELQIELESMDMPLEDKARTLHKARTESTYEVRAKDPSYLNRAYYEIRDMVKYKNLKGRRDFDLFNKHIRGKIAKENKLNYKDISDDAVFERIISSSSKGNPAINAKYLKD